MLKLEYLHIKIIFLKYVKKISAKRAIILILLILALAVFFRFWRLEQIPPGLYPDMAINGNDAIEALQTGDFKIFYPENNGREGLFINLIAFSFWLFGPSVWAIKVVPAVIGVLTILGLYLFTRQLFSYLAGAKAEFIALVASFLTTISFWHVNFSRIGFRAIMVPFFLVWSFYFLFRAIRIYELYPNYPNTEGAASFERKPASRAAGQGWSGWLGAKSSPRLLYFLLAGIFFGLGFHTYIAFRVAPLVLVPVLFFAFVAYWPIFRYWLKNRSTLGGFFKFVYIKDGWWHWDIFFITIIIAALPMVIYFAQHPQDFVGRTGQVSVFAAENPLKELAITTAKSLGMFNVWGDCNWRHNYVYPEGSSLSFGGCQPVLFWPVGLLFIIGFFWSVFQAFKSSNWQQKKWPVLTVYWTLIFWFFAMLLPEILSREGLPHALRSIGAIPAVFIFAGLGLFLIFDFLKNRFAKKGAALVMLYLLVFVFLGWVGYIEFNKYFFDWSQRKEVKDEFAQSLVDEGNYLNSLPSNIEKYVMVNQGGVPVPYPDGIPMPAQTIMFITYGKPNIKYLLPSENAQAFLGAKKAVLVLLTYDDDLFSMLQDKIQEGKVEEIQKEFLVFKIGF